MNEKLELLYDTYGKEQTNQLFDEYSLDKENNFLISHSSAIKNRIGNIEVLKSFLKYFSTKKDINETCNVGELAHHLKVFNTEFITEKKVNKQELEVFQENDEEEKEPHTNDIGFQNIEQTLNTIKESVFLLHQDTTDEKILEYTVKIKDILTNQINTKTERKATFDQVEIMNEKIKQLFEDTKHLNTQVTENISKNIEDISSKLKNTSLNSNKEQNKYFFAGMIIMLITVMVLMAGFYFIL